MSLEATHRPEALQGAQSALSCQWGGASVHPFQPLQEPGAPSVRPPLRQAASQSEYILAPTASYRTSREACTTPHHANFPSFMAREQAAASGIHHAVAAKNVRGRQTGKAGFGAVGLAGTNTKEMFLQRMRKVAVRGGSLSPGRTSSHTQSGAPPSCAAHRFLPSTVSSSCLLQAAAAPALLSPRVLQFNSAWSGQSGVLGPACRYPCRHAGETQA